MDQKATIARFVEAFNASNFDIIKETFAENYFTHPPDVPAEHPAKMFHSMAVDLKVACPDMTLRLDNLREDGDVVTADMQLSGTYTNGLWGALPTNEKVVWNDVVWIKFVGERMAVSWENPDFPSKLKLLRQFMLVPPPDQMDQPAPYPSSPPEFLLKVVMTGQVAEKPCSHIDQIKVTQPSTDVCEQCVEAGDEWPALRMCLVCGFIGCCDTSRNTHMKKHYEATGHSIFRSIRLEEEWIWCYEDNAFLSGRHLKQ